MLHTDALGLLVGAVLLGAVHGIEPGHGWPVAASYALDQTNKWLSGFAASFLLGIGHLISSLAMVAVFFYAKSYFSLTQVNDPISIDLFATTFVIGGPVSIVAGVLLVLLGLREYYGGGHSHGTSQSHDDQPHAQSVTAQTHDHAERVHDDHTHDTTRTHDHDHDHDHNHDHPHEEGHTHSTGHSHHARDQRREGILGRIESYVPFVGGHSHDHSQDDLDEAAERGLFGIAWFAFVLGFAHEEEFEIIAMCTGSAYCLELMTAYALTVIVGIVGLTMLLIAGYHHYEQRVEQYTPYLPLFSAAVLVLMGIGFITGLF